MKKQQEEKIRQCANGAMDALEATLNAVERNAKDGKRAVKIVAKVFGDRMKKFAKRKKG